MDDRTLQEGIHHLIGKEKPYEFLENEDDIYSVEDLKPEFDYYL